MNVTQDAISKSNKDWDIPVMTRAMKRAAEENPIFIFNVGPMRWTCSGNRIIQACPEGAKYSPALVIPAIVSETVVVDTRKMARHDEDGMDVARDVVGLGPFKSKGDDLTQYGVFIAAGEEPTKAELLEAHAKLNAHYARLVQTGDNYHAQGGKAVDDIQALHRDAVKRLGLSRPWAAANQAMVPCAGCQQPVLPGTVRCPHAGCGAVLDEAKARVLYPHLYQTAQAAPTAKGKAA
jgi:hypothetical protein